MKNNIEQATTVLKFTYVLVPIIAGVDKFTNLLTNWGQYLSTDIINLLPIETSTLMMLVGIIEITAGILVYLKPKTGSIIVMGWLIAIALTLVVGGRHFDVAVRDLVIAVGAYSLYKLSK